jgi:hypothetical protein
MDIITRLVRQRKSKTSRHLGPSTDEGMWIAEADELEAINAGRHA